VNTKGPKVDRKGGVIFAMLGVAGTLLVVLAAMAFMAARRNRFHSLQAITRDAWGSLQIWGGAVILCAAAVGFCLGSDRTIRLLGHLWFTERPRNWPLSVGLWIALVTVSLAAFGLFRSP
jgi:hypothetical protein